MDDAPNSYRCALTKIGAYLIYELKENYKNRILYGLPSFGRFVQNYHYDYHLD